MQRMDYGAHLVAAAWMDTRKFAVMAFLVMARVDGILRAA